MKKDKPIEFQRRILPPLEISNDQLDKSVPTDPDLKAWMAEQKESGMTKEERYTAEDVIRNVLGQNDENP
jgi:hypothetical protein